MRIKKEIGLYVLGFILFAFCARKQITEQEKSIEEWVDSFELIRHRGEYDIKIHDAYVQQSQLIINNKYSIDIVSASTKTRGEYIYDVVEKDGKRISKAAWSDTFYVWTSDDFYKFYYKFEEFERVLRENGFVDEDGNYLGYKNRRKKKNN